MATPKTMPRFRAAATVAEATPRFSGVTALKAAALLGGRKMAVPMPARERRHIIEKKDALTGIEEREKSEQAISAMARVQRKREPMRSKSAPEKGETTNKATKMHAIMPPAVFTG